MEYETSDIFGVQDSQRQIENDDAPIFQNIEDEDNDDDNENRLDEDTGNRSDEAIEVPDPAAPKLVKPKKVIKNPQPKLDPTRLMGTRGIGILENWFKDVHFKGRGHEKDDLDVLMKHMEHWTHRLYPKLPFDQTITQIEKLGMKKIVQVQMKKIRLDMFSSITPDEIIEDEDDIARLGDDEPHPPTEVDIFDELISNSRVDKGLENLNKVSTSSSCKLTEEQKERIERNKKLAFQRRQQKIKEREEMENALQIKEMEEMENALQIKEREEKENSLQSLNNSLINTHNILTDINTSTNLISSINNDEEMNEINSTSVIIDSNNVLMNSDLEINKAAESMNDNILQNSEDNICTENDALMMLDD